jgi:beta-glucosidase
MTKYQLPVDSRLNSRQFIYGVATSSFQIEGGADHRLPCIWDTFCDTTGKIADNSNGLISCDHYHLWQQDIELIDDLGVDAYRLSIAWPRVIQANGELNPEGVQFYLNILDTLKAKNIKAFVTLYHWDLPQFLADQGGWLNRQTAYAFADYTAKIAQAFGDRVYAYATLNEPFCSSYLGYEIGVHAPGQTSQAAGRQAAHYLLLAHGLAMAELRKYAPHALNGIVLNFTPCYPASDNPADIDAAKYADDYFNQWYLQPIMEGKYPDILASLPDEVKPTITEGDMAIIAAPIDYLGVNFYTRAIYRADEQHIFEQLPPPAPLTDIGWEIYPQAFTDLLVSLNQRYHLPPIYITENGGAFDDHLDNGEIADNDRIDYYQQHLLALDKAITLGVDVKGYFAWSLMDNFEWAEGYLKRFGIVYVDYTTQKRTLKNSAKAYKALLEQRK